MKRRKPAVIGRKRVSIRVLMSQSDYQALAEIARMERSDISTLVRRAVAHYFFIPAESNVVNHNG